MTYENNQELIMTIGLPGCGKSTWAKKYAEEHSYTVHSSDAIREELETEDNQIVFKELHKRIKEDLADGKSCIYDATNVAQKKRKATIQELKREGVTVKAVLFPVPLDICKKRNLMRDKRWQVPGFVYPRMLRAFTPPMFQEGFDILEMIYCGEDYALPHSACDLTLFEQDNGHHSLTLGNHLKKAAEHIENSALNTPYKAELKEAAAWHDIGKFYTKDFHNAKGEVTEDAHYYGHENIGSYIYLLDWQKRYLSGNEGRQTEFDPWYVASLIAWHMRPYAAWNSSEKAKERDRWFLGEEMYKDLILLHEADVCAH